MRDWLGAAVVSAAEALLDVPTSEVGVQVHDIKVRF